MMYKIRIEAGIDPEMSEFLNDLSLDEVVSKLNWYGYTCEEYNMADGEGVVYVWEDYI